MNKKAILERVIKDDVKFISFQFSDVTGKVKSVDMPVEQLEDALDNGIWFDALAHCVEGYVGMASDYHPYYEALALYGVKLIGRSLFKAYENGDNIEARRDLSMAAAFGGISFTKGLGLGHAIGHAIGSYHHISHGSSCAIGLLIFVRANRVKCEDQFEDLAWALGRTDNLEKSLENLYSKLNMPLRIRDLGIPKNAVNEIAYETYINAVNLAANPTPLNEKQVLKLIQEGY